VAASTLSQGHTDVNRHHSSSAILRGELRPLLASAACPTTSPWLAVQRAARTSNDARRRSGRSSAHRRTPTRPQDETAGSGQVRRLGGCHTRRRALNRSAQEQGERDHVDAECTHRRSSGGEQTLCRPGRARKRCDHLEPTRAHRHRWPGHQQSHEGVDDGEDT